MPTPVSALRRHIEDHLGAVVSEVIQQGAELTMVVAPAQLLAVATQLRDQPQFAFEQLIDLCGVDYLSFGDSQWETSEKATYSGFSRGVMSEPVGTADVSTTSEPPAPRYAVVYHLLSYRNNQRLRLRCWLPDTPPRLPSIIPLWANADWYEREAFDLFGILFDGHPDLRRILTDYGFIGYPFRKDFPLSGEVEARYDPDKERVIYEPVSIQPRVLVPKVIRSDTRYAAGDGKES